MPKVRCAIYVRKSTEKGLEQNFNTLHNQEEACKNYILSQAFNEWEFSKTYEDGGISGGTMKRPGLKEMIADIKAGKIQTVVVYKVDRLSRSIIDFHNMMKEFEQYNCNFVSITQAFDTSNSMGKLTLNMLLSFAQFEREVSSERIRDKLAASKAKGMWLGGMPPLGYDIVEKQLKVNEQEAKQVQYVFEKYLEMKSLKDVAEHLNEEGYSSKKWISQKGNKCGGGQFSPESVSRILKNKIYIGMIEHKRLEKIYEGKHQKIIKKELFEEVKVLLDANRLDYSKTKKIRRALLYKKLFSITGEEFIKKGGSSRGRRYSYYAIKGKHLPLNQMDEIVIKSIETFLNGNFKDIIPPHVVEQIKLISFEELNRKRRYLKRFIQNAIQKIIYKEDILEVHFQKEEEIYEKLISEGFYNSQNKPIELEQTPKGIILKQEFYIENKILSNRYQSNSKTIMSKSEMNESLIRAISIGWLYRKQYEKGETMDNLRKRMNVRRRTVYKYLSLGYLSPKIINDIMKNKIPKKLTVNKLIEIASKSMNFKDQKIAFYATSS